MCVYGRDNYRLEIVKTYYTDGLYRWPSLPQPKQRVSKIYRGAQYKKMADAPKYIAPKRIGTAGVSINELRLT